MSLGRILIAEDNELNQYLLKSVLKKRGYDITLASDGVEALDCACKVAFDLILTDIHMPHMTGVEFVRALKIADSPNLNTPIVAITADCDDDVRFECLGVGMNDVIHKPINREKLISLVSSFLGRDPVYFGVGLNDHKKGFYLVLCYYMH